MSKEYDKPDFKAKHYESQCLFEPRELIKNGSFENVNPARPEEFAYWNGSSSPEASISSSNIAYEGLKAAQINTAAAGEGEKVVTLSQKVSLTPGCFYQLSFAENLDISSPVSIPPPSLTARVFFATDDEQFDLINILIKKDGEPDVDKGYTFHRKVSDIAVPSSIVDATVEFTFNVPPNIRLEWLLDGVSLYAAAQSSSCCNTCIQDERKSPHSCEIEELVKNGSFEMLETGTGDRFLNWLAFLSQDTALRQSPIAFKGRRAALFEGTGTASETRRITLMQSVSATPGCRYQLSFAENFLRHGRPLGSGLDLLIARVYFIDRDRRFNNEFNLMRLIINKSDTQSDEDKGYVLHQIASQLPVPCNVSELIVSFEFRTQPIPGTRWLLDGVSLRAISPKSECR